MPRDSLKPKGVTTSYAFFVQICREEHKNQHPDEKINFGEFSKQCADRWKTMTEEEKARFQQLGQRDRERYNEEMQHYVPPPGEKVRRIRGMKRPKDPNAPKRALSAFLHYSSKYRSEIKAINPDFSVGEISKELGRRWNEMSEVDRAPFDKMTQDDRERYDRDMEQFRNGTYIPYPRGANGHQTLQ